ncbi:hypothetical protein [Dehalobacter sp. MCB1]|uniref:hypothetical protein n=1 Tax=Dehalobacter sp. MCB1 TaxID=1844756 RepID=UPI0013147EAC|nr:hypothetical protein [Dehalobacter sp. MCB1]
MEIADASDYIEIREILETYGYSEISYYDMIDIKSIADDFYWKHINEQIMKERDW